MREALKDGNEEMELTDADEALLEQLRAGARTQGYLVDVTEYPRHKVHQRLQLLAAAGYIENIHDSTALYELRRDPAEGDGV